jgi:hypothetical protein
MAERTKEEKLRILKAFEDATAKSRAAQAEVQATKGEQSRKLLSGEMSAKEFMDMIPGARSAIRNLPEGGAMAGGLAGFEMGLKAPIPHPMVKGVVATGAGALGAMAGYSAGVNVQEGLEAIDPDAFGTFDNPIGDVTKRTLRVGLEDAVGTGFGAMLSKGLTNGMPYMMKALGVGKKEMDLANEVYRDAGIDLPPYIVSKYSRALGTIHRSTTRLPFVGKYFRDSYNEIGEQIANRQNSIMNRLGDEINTRALGYNVQQIYLDRFKYVRDEAEKGFLAAKNEIAATGDTVSGELAQAYAQKHLKKLMKQNKGIPFAPPGMSAKEAAKKGFQKGDKVSNFMYRISQLGVGDMDVHTYDGLMGEFKDLNSKIMKGDNHNHKKIFFELEQELKALRQTFKDPANAERLDVAEQMKIDLLKPFKSPAARGMRESARIQDFDTLVDISMDNPANVKNTLAIVAQGKGGEGFVKALARRKMTKVWEDALNNVNASEEAIGDLDWGLIRREMGLSKNYEPLKTSSRYQAYKELFSVTDVDIDEVTTFLKYAHKAVENAPPDVGAFIARRAGISGLTGVMNLVAAGGALSTGAAGGPALIPGVTATLALRNFNRVISDPKMLKLSSVAMSDAPFKTRRAAALAFIRGLGETEDYDEVVQAINEIPYMPDEGAVQLGIRGGERAYDRFFAPEENPLVNP